MYSILTGSFILSVLHAAIPNHWLPVIAIGRKEKWTATEVLQVTIAAALAHGLSTILIGLLLGFLGQAMAQRISHFTHLAAPVIFIVLGLFFIYRHHRHRYFQLSDVPQKMYSKKRIVITLVLAMFFSPCMEIEAYFLMAGTQSKWLVAVIAVMYIIITTVGMALLVSLAYKGLLKLNWHALEHNAGIVTGITLIITGILSFFIF
jgi:nickel/cobalt exporter